MFKSDVSEERALLREAVPDGVTRPAESVHDHTLVGCDRERCARAPLHPARSGRNVLSDEGVTALVVERCATIQLPLGDGEEVDVRRHLLPTDALRAGEADVGRAGVSAGAVAVAVGAGAGVVAGVPRAGGAVIRHHHATAHKGEKNHKLHFNSFGQKLAVGFRTTQYCLCSSLGSPLAGLLKSINNFINFKSPAKQQKNLSSTITLVNSLIFFNSSFGDVQHTSLLFYPGIVFLFQSI